MLERFKKNSPIRWKAVGLAMVTASNSLMQYYASDHVAVRVVGVFLFVGTLISYLAVDPPKLPDTTK